MILQIERGPEPGTLRLIGELDLATADLLNDALCDLVGNEHVITLDCSRLTFMDSSGLRLLLQIAMSQNGAGSTALVVKKPSEAVRRVLEIALPHGMAGLRIED